MSGIFLQDRVATFEVQSGAMEPTIRKGTKLAVERYYYARNPLARWDVILFILSHTETNLIPTEMNFKGEDGKARKFARPHFPYIKRVVGLPGEVLRFVEEGLVCNGKPLEFPDDIREYFRKFTAPDKYSFGGKDFQVPEDEVFVLSDNAQEGVDSRHTGTVPLRCVLGRIAL
ncbi:signal peptidase I [Mesorhizobium sp. M1380]|uniref:signal peptidase I n=1 Tax=Mesorhizobium sp. M1380 TaxID=2957093 RepID=UPI00333D1DF9